MKASEILSAASELPATQGTPARDANGEPCYSCSEEAVCFCAIGAISRAAANLYGICSYPMASVDVANRAARALGFSSLVDISDGFPSLMPQVWSKAIELAEELEAA